MSSSHVKFERLPRPKPGSPPPSDFTTVVSISDLMNDIQTVLVVRIIAGLLERARPFYCAQTFQNISTIFADNYHLDSHVWLVVFFLVASVIKEIYIRNENSCFQRCNQNGFLRHW